MAERNHEAARAGGYGTRIVKTGLVVAGTIAVGRSAQLAYRHHVMPRELQDERVRTYKKGAIILTAGALALERGEPLTIANIRAWTELNRNNTSLGINFLQEKGLADRQVGAGHEVDLLWATEPLLAAAAAPQEYPLLRDAMLLLAGRPQG